MARRKAREAKHDFGPFGDQDVHYHPCVSDDDKHACSIVVVGDGRDCGGRHDGTHRQVDLEVKDG